MIKDDQKKMIMKEANNSRTELKATRLSHSGTKITFSKKFSQKINQINEATIAILK